MDKNEKANTGWIWRLSKSEIILELENNSVIDHQAKVVSNEEAEQSTSSKAENATAVSNEQDDSFESAHSSDTDSTMSDK